MLLNIVCVSVLFRKLIQHKESCKFALYYDLKHLAENSSLNSTTCLLAAEEMVTKVL